MYDTKHSSNSLILASILAIFCHVLVFILIAPTTPRPHVEPRLPLSVTISSTAASSPSETGAPEEELTPVNIQDDSPLVFHRPHNLPGHPQRVPMPAGDTSWIGSLFSSENRSRPLDQDAPLSDLTQLNTREVPILSTYHAQLIQILARNKYHDTQYAFSSLDRTRKVILQLKLHQSGALLRVNVDKSSGDLELDAAAQRSAYAASPFPPPPASDAHLNFTYPIEILYQPSRERR